MSHDPRPLVAHGRRRAVALLGALALATTLAGCGGDIDAAVPVPVAADETTAQLAAVEAARQCVIVGRAFPAEADITADLETRLADAGLTYEQWKDWHDALVSSPDLVEQYAAAEQDGCPGA